MLICALDFGARGIGAVLTAYAGTPFVIESHRFSADIVPQQRVSAIVAWNDNYGGIEIVVCCDADPWPLALLQSLRQSGLPLHWVGGSTVRQALASWQAVQPPRHCLRAALLASSVYLREGEWHEEMGERAAYDLLRSQALDAELDLMVAGAQLCPNHLLEDCSLCGGLSA